MAESNNVGAGPFAQASKNPEERSETELVQELIGQVKAELDAHQVGLGAIFGKLPGAQARELFNAQFPNAKIPNLPTVAALRTMRDYLRRKRTPPALQETADLSTATWDAREWARRFMQSAAHLNAPRAPILDESWLIGWFANAIMAGYDKARRESAQPSVRVSAPYGQESPLDNTVVVYAEIRDANAGCETVQFDPVLATTLSPAEALYGFAAWLTTREEPVTLSARHPAGKAAELVEQFCKANALGEPREGWGKLFKMPEEQPDPRHKVIYGPPAR